jgi:hypothetical protein
MASNEDMVPTGLPYGAREKTAAAMKVAGVPLSSASGGGSPAPTTAQAASPPAAAPAPAAPAPVSRQALAEYDVFANREPTTNYQPAPERQVMREKIRQSPNAVMQAIYRRMDGYKNG